MEEVKRSQTQINNATSDRDFLVEDQLIAVDIKDKANSARTLDQRSGRDGSTSGRKRSRQVRVFNKTPEKSRKSSC